MSKTLPVALRAAVLKEARAGETNGAQGYRCASCMQVFVEKDVEVDHITPEADGGSDDPTNLQVLCAPRAGAGCHRQKSREETKARARAARAGERRSLVVTGLLALFGFGSAGTFAYAAYLSATGQPLVPFLHRLHALVGYAMIGVIVVGILYAAEGASLMVPIEAEPEPTEDAAEPKVAGGLAERVRAALAPLMGDDISASAVGTDGVAIKYSNAVKDHEDNERYKILLRVNTKMNGRWQPVWDGENNRVIFTRRPDFPALVRHPGLDPDRPWNLIPVADGVTINLKLTSHVLVIGVTNGGKTSLMRSIVVAACDSARREQAELVLIDPKRVELIGFRGWAGVRAVLTGDQDMWDAPIRLAAEMEERYRLHEEEKVSLSSFTPIILILDEYEDYVEAMRAHWLSIDPVTKRPRKVTGEAEAPPVAAMAKLLRKARRCRIHIIIGTQRPDAKWFGGSARDNLQCRIGVGPLSRSAALMLFERSDVGRDLPPEAKGRFTTELLDGTFEEGQSWWVPDPGNADGENTPQDEEHLTRLRTA